MLLDLDPYTGRRLDEEFRTLVSEMRNFSEELAARPLFVALSKADAFGINDDSVTLEDLAAREDMAEKGIRELIELLKEEGLYERSFIMSSASGFGLEALKMRLSRALIEMGPRVFENKVAQVVSLGNTSLFDDAKSAQGEDDLEDDVDEDEELSDEDYETLDEDDMGDDEDA
jgi:hypothetical protein